MITADLVLTGGKVLTLDRSSRIVQAIAVRGERITALGRDEEIAGFVGPGTRRLNSAIASPCPRSSTSASAGPTRSAASATSASS